MASARSSALAIWLIKKQCLIITPGTEFKLCLMVTSHLRFALTHACSSVLRDDVEWNDDQLEEAKRKVQVQAESQLPESIRGILSWQEAVCPRATGVLT